MAALAGHYQQCESEGSPQRTHKANTSYCATPDVQDAANGDPPSPHDPVEELGAITKALDLDVADTADEEVTPDVDEGGARVNLAMRDLSRVPAAVAAAYGAKCRELNLFENEFAACEKVRRCER